MARRVKGVGLEFYYTNEWGREENRAVSPAVLAVGPSYRGVGSDPYALGEEGKKKDSGVEGAHLYPAGRKEIASSECRLWGRCSF